MSSETYTFACPVCAVRLSVPKALAGVRGPCPQCHHEITAPEPEPALVAAAAAPPEAAFEDEPPPDPPAPAVPEPVAELPKSRGLGESSVVAPAPAPPPPAGTGEMFRAAGAEPPPLPRASEPAASMAAPPDLPVAPSPPERLVRSGDLGWREPGEGMQSVEPVAEPRGRPAPAARRSPLKALVAIMLLLGLLAAAGLNLLPAASLRVWLGKVLPPQVVDAVAPPSTLPPAAEPSPPAVPLSAAPEIEIRPALSEPAPGFDPEVPLPPPAGAPVIPPAAVPDAAEPAAPSPPPEPVPAAASPSASLGKGAASLLPDISPAPLAPGGGEAFPATDAQAGAQEALTLFLQARTWPDRLVLSHGGGSLRDEMEQYYRKAKDGPQTPTSVQFIASAPLPDGVGTLQVFHVTFADLPQGFPVPVRQTEDGWKIDWQAFVEFREGRLKKFLAKYQEAPAIFRVRLQRAHYQDRAVPNLEKKHVFRISAPIDGHEGYVFVDQGDSIAGPKIADKLQWDTIHHVMAKLKWVKGTTGRGYVELRDIVSESWREQP